MSAQEPALFYLVCWKQAIARILAALHSGAREIVATLGADDLPFRTRLLYVDPNRNYIIVEAPEDKTVSSTLFLRPRLNFVSEFAGWHIEFPVADPQKGTLAGRAAVRFKFPDVIVSHQRRAEQRVSPPPMQPLRCIADAGGFAAFEAHIVDIAQGGIGFLLYSSDITLEPGTVLKGCHVDAPGRAAVVVDLEVRYSTAVTRPDGEHAHRSGCVFLNPTREVMDMIDSLVPSETLGATLRDVPGPAEAPMAAKPLQSPEAPKEPLTPRPSATARPSETPKLSETPRYKEAPTTAGAPKPREAPMPPKTLRPSEKK